MINAQKLLAARTELLRNSVIALAQDFKEDTGLVIDITLKVDGCIENGTIFYNCETKLMNEEDCGSTKGRLSK